MEVKLKSPAKKMNAPFIKQATGIDNYKGRADQRKALMECITVENYRTMYERIRKMDSDDQVIGSSNFDRFIEYLDAEDDTWIERINSKLEE